MDNKFEKLTKKLREEAGFEVYVWLAGRNDLNDGDRQELDTYVRASNNLRSEFSGYSYDSGLPIEKKIMPRDILPNDRLNIKYQKAMIFDGIYNDFPEFFSGRVEWKPRYKSKVFMIGNEKEIEEIKYEKQKLIETRKIKREGLLSVVSPYKKINIETEKDVPVPEKKKVRVPIKLDNIIENYNEESAYVMLMDIRPPVNIEGRYPTCMWVGVVAGKTLMEDTVSYLLENSDKYIDVIKGFIPKDKFPNVNKHLLESKPNQDILGVMFLDYTTNKTFVSDYR